MERLLIALDCQPDCLKVVDYVVRILKGTQGCEFVIFNILPTASPDKIRMEEVRRIEHVHAARPDLAGYFWKEEDEKNTTRYFAQAKEKLIIAGFSQDLISYLFSVESGDMAEIILAKAAELKCSTIVLGRRSSGSVKKFLLGSVSTSVFKLSRHSAIWFIKI